MREVGVVTFVSVKYDLGEVHAMPFSTLQDRKGHHPNGSKQTNQIKNKKRMLKINMMKVG